MPLFADIWRVGVIESSIQAVAAAGGLHAAPVRWLPEEPSYRFLADPFGLWRDGRIHLFAEAYDYRTRHGVIDYLELDSDYRPVRRETVIREPWHLSYPVVFEADGETWMTPEAFRSGTFTLYRAERFPDVWEPVAKIAFDTPAIDPTFFQWEGRWWCAYSPDGAQRDKQGKMHLAHADRLEGPWTPHPGNPVRIDLASSRPGGTPFIHENRLHLPVQDCTRTYGGDLRLLVVNVLTPNRFEAEATAILKPPVDAGRYTGGRHTLAACGPVTLFDAKQQKVSPRGLAIDIARKIRARGAKAGRSA
ncbi:formyl transferase [Caulobacter sp. 602-1]|uniref:glucosamine inositolphosphorylceramide transferase family protein n=1 Tax=Caulobacter sp. 602-1 TaxID=2492472 RepID=UPI000F63384F|nr:formyl transferase [Caulobacter sp. 602-1]RRN64037.1 formyl transferase [Caulobacter sp. 602-1]